MAFRKIDLTAEQKLKYAREYVEARKHPRALGKVSDLADAISSKHKISPPVHPMTLRSWAIANGLFVPQARFKPVVDKPAGKKAAKKTK